MKGFLGIFGRGTSSLLDQADGLVKAAYSNAVSQLGPLMSKFPILQEVYVGRASQAEYVEHFDFIFTVASVFVAVHSLRGAEIDAERRREALDRIQLRLREWHPAKALAGFDHCQAAFDQELQEFAKRSRDARQNATDAIGSWIVADILQRFPETPEEMILVRTTGAMVMSKFYEYWKF